MGGAKALQIPRSRFAPVKTTSDLLALRSDAYVLTEDFRVELAPARNGVPSLIGCTKLVIEGPVEFAAGTVIEGEVTITNASGEKKTAGPGTLKDTKVEL